MEYGIGLSLALSVCLFARFSGFDRSRAFYPTVLIVTVSYYALFAILGGSMHALLAECGVVLVFVVASVPGFKRNLWLIVAALAAHGIFDFFHHHFWNNPGLPVWWPMFCMSFDLAAAAYLTWLLLRRKSLNQQLSEP